MNTETDKQVVGRFFEALETLIDRRAIGGIQPFCERYGIDKRNLYHQRENLDVGHIHFDWLVPLVKTYGISATWLITGEGGMFIPFFEDNLPFVTRKRRSSPSTAAAEES